ncbi:M1 family metallopeptidase [Luteibaculum oceani]|uniref:M1 family metallopeptidase n=1 Tax=Luteibaculum oceani TaxID=1294296 RepID=UPI001CB8FDC6|nr:M1 family metallopeptidase [Luteibaculum oceani]
MIKPSFDPHSYAQPEEAVVKHLSWEANIRFDERFIDAIATWQVECKQESKHVVFDSDRLVINNVWVDGKQTEWNIVQQKDHLGTGLVVDLPKKHKYKVEVKIQYRTVSSAKALFWAVPQQTYGKVDPFMFSQSQAILARTWIPCQDSPGIRFTYDAKVTVPTGMMALMSAENPVEKSFNGVYRFRMEQPIPSYLMAIAVGDIEYRAIGPKTGVYAEPGLINEAANEFSELNEMMAAAEKLYGTYVWGKYDILVLPPSFPFGGMENPRLTFATPTIISGDKSLVSLVAHELAHSWSGNLVTNRTWDDFWLNEGFTVYFENRIMEEVKGKEYANMLANLGYSDLMEELENLKDSPDDTKLKLDLAGRNPDDGMTSIAYEKGFFLLKLLEVNWGRENLDNFLRSYFAQYKFKVMDTESFVSLLRQQLGDGPYTELRIDEWIYKPGVPSNIPKINSERFNKVDIVASNWNAGMALSPEVAKEWTTHEWLRFIEKIPGNTAVERLKELDDSYGLTNSGNAEILCAWLEKSLMAGYDEVLPSTQKFLYRVGRRKFLVPIYKALIASNKKNIALDIYKEARGSYHAVSTQTIDDLLGFNA